MKVQVQANRLDWGQGSGEGAILDFIHSVPRIRIIFKLLSATLPSNRLNKTAKPSHTIATHDRAAIVTATVRRRLSDPLPSPQVEKLQKASLQNPVRVEVTSKYALLLRCRAGQLPLQYGGLITEFPESSPLSFVSFIKPLPFDRFSKTHIS